MIDINRIQARMMEGDAPPGADLAEARLMILSDGRAGHESQSIGVAEMLGFKDPEVITIKREYPQKWLGWLPVTMLFRNFHRMERDIAKADIVMGTGYQVSRVLRKLKQNNPRLFTVCLLRPAGAAKDYDVVAALQHDHVYKTENVVITLGAANRITRDRLKSEGDRWTRRLSAVRTPRLAVLVGGSSKHGGFSVKAAEDLMKPVIELAKKKNIGLLVTTSRRTGKAATAKIMELLEQSNHPYFFWQPEDPTNRDNPYMAYLALADAILAPADSISMVSESASSGKPVYLMGKPAGLPKKFRNFYDALAKQGRVKWWDGELNMRAPAAGLMDTLMIAGFIRARWTKRSSARS